MYSNDTAKMVLKKGVETYVWRTDSKSHSLQVFWVSYWEQILYMYIQLYDSKQDKFHLYSK